MKKKEPTTREKIRRMVWLNSIGVEAITAKLVNERKMLRLWYKKIVLIRRDDRYKEVAAALF